MSETPTVSFDDFTKLDIRIAKILEVRDHPNADKLLCLKIDLGDEQRQIVAGIKPYYSHEALLGRQIAVVANLEPRKLRGEQSQGMLLAATRGEEQIEDVVILVPEKELPLGSKVS